MKHSEWQVKKRIELDYQRSIQKLMDNFLKKLPNIHVVNPHDVIREFKHYCQNGDFARYIDAAASHMITGLYVDSTRTWRRAASEGMQGRKMFEMLKDELNGPIGAKVREMVDRNAHMISSLPDDVAMDVNRYIQQESMNGTRASEIQSGLEYIPTPKEVIERVRELTETRIALISRTETSKASTALTRARSEDIGLGWYVWRTSNDARVRESHGKMNRVLVSWSDAPSPERIVGVKSNLGQYHAGECPNCRCYAQPVTNMNRIEWPVKVHTSGIVTRMTRAHFENMTGMRMAA
jgi:SPP1 gp7 family putative phage head morphogenesis protein